LRYIYFMIVLLASMLCHGSELDQAREYIGAMEYSQAIQQIQAYLATHPEDIEARLLLARTFAWDNQYAQAQRVYDQLLQLEQDNSEYLFGKAQALLWQNKHQAAIPLLESVIRLAPEQADAWRLLILSLQQSQNKADQQRAHELLVQARARFPKINWDVIAN
jgi:cytochrome c-type biogenesis protein CcmH/NrfG